MSDKTPDQIAAELADYFDPSEVKFKPAVVSGSRAMALHYIDARIVMDRLDSVLGPMNWQDAYEFLPDGSCLCKLSLRIGGEWITKMDVGGESEQKDEGDRHKAAVSDALKRTAVKFGVGRYLYRLPQTWADYDPQKKQFVKPPQLPDWARPGGAKQAKPAKPAAAPAQPAAATTTEAVLKLLAQLGECEEDLVAHFRQPDLAHLNAKDLLRARDIALECVAIRNLAETKGVALDDVLGRYSASSLLDLTDEKRAKAFNGLQKTREKKAG